MTEQKEQYLVSEVASLTGLSSSTLRLWEQHGLVTPHRSASGYRYFSATDMERVRHIKRLRDIQGLNLAAIKTALPKLENKQNSLPPIGERLKQQRKQKGLTLRQVAKAINVAPSLISALETTHQGASYATLFKLAELYGTSLNALHDHSMRSGKETLTRAGHGQKIPMAGGIDIESLSEGGSKIYAEKWVVQPGQQSHGCYEHEGEEIIYVLKGEFEISIECNEPYTLHEGDSLQFESTRAHSWKNNSKEEAVVLWISL